MFLQTFIRKFIHTIIPLITGILFSVAAEAQSFNYSFAKDSVGWQELNSQTILNANNAAWNFSYTIPIGFSFNYLGAPFDSLRIETNGYLVFDNDRYYAFTAFLGFADCTDSVGNHAVLGYSLSGTNGNRILKIQFKNMSNESHGHRFFSYQLWLKENNTIEVHIGPNDFQPGIIVSVDSSWVQSVLLDSLSQPTDSLVIVRDTIFTNRDSMQAYRVGLINMNMDMDVNGFFVGGDVNSPSGQPADQNNPQPAYFFRAPSPGTRYTFTPNFN